MDFIIEKIPALSQNLYDKTSIELHIEAEDKNNVACEVSRVKYTLTS
jgi:hypothetical protein